MVYQELQGVFQNIRWCWPTCSVCSKKVGSWSKALFLVPWILAPVKEVHKIYQENLIRPVLISCLLPGNYVRLRGDLSCIWWLRPEYPPTSSWLCCCWWAESLSEGLGGCGVAEGVPESSESLEFLAEDRNSLAGHSNVSFARALASWEVVFFNLFCDNTNWTATLQESWKLQCRTQGQTGECW